MAKAKKSKSSALNGLVITKTTVSAPSNNWLEKETSHRVIDLRDDHEPKVDDNKEAEEVTQNKRPEADGVKNKVAKKARDLVKDEINELYGEMIKHGRMTLEKAIAIGGKLSEIKATLKHGQFGNWIDSSLDFDQKTAERYMKLHNGREKLKIDTMSNITNALRMLDEHSRTAKPKAVKFVDPVEVNVDAAQLVPQMGHMDKPEDVKEPVIEEPWAGEVIAPAFDIVKAPEMPVFVASVPEEVLAELLEVTKGHVGKCQYQVIRKDGQIKLNEFFNKRLGLMVN